MLWKSFEIRTNVEIKSNFLQYSWAMKVLWQSNRGDKSRISRKSGNGSSSLQGMKIIEKCGGHLKMCRTRKREEGKERKGKSRKEENSEAMHSCGQKKNRGEKWSASSSLAAGGKDRQLVSRTEANSELVKGESDTEKWLWRDGDEKITRIFDVRK